MVICGQNFDFSVLNANDLDRFEDAQEKMQARNAAQTERFHRGGIRLGDHVRAQTRIAMDCIDTILGAGASAVWGWMKTTWPLCMMFSKSWATPLLPRNSAIPPEPPIP